MRFFAAYRGLLGNPPLVRLLAGEFVSSVGDWLYLVALLVVVYAESGSPVLLGLVGAARVLPYVVLSVPAGIVADRFDRRLILMVTDVARGLVMLALAFLVATESPLIAIVALTIVATCFSAFFGPTIGAFLPSLISDESQLGPANSAWATLDNLAFVIGPAIGGLLIAGGGLTLAFLLNAVSFAVVAWVLWRLPHPRRSVNDRPERTPIETPEARREPVPAGAGIDARVLLVTTGLRPLAGLALINVVAGFFFGGLSVITVIIAVQVVRAGESATGYLNAAIGLGGVVGAAASSALVLRPRLSLSLLAGGMFLGAGFFLLSRAGSLAFALLAMAVASAGSLLVEVVATTIFQRVVPDAVRGRALGVMETAAVSAYAAGSLAVPIAATAAGTTVVLAVAGLAIAVASVAAVLLVGPAAVAGVPPERVRERLRGISVFSGLPAARLDAAARQMAILPVRAGEVVIEQGDRADRFYVIDSGTFLVTQRDREAPPQVRRRMGPGDVFGEIGLLTGSPRTATVTAEADGELMALDRRAFLELVGSGPGLTSRLLDLHRGAAATAMR
ncbi:MAG: MFS transporter [Chloroflexota bacterium]|nr:MFS transporter [Chloroflexota bacterium]